MKKSLRRALWAGAAVVVLSAGVPLVQASAATACAPAWSSTQVYLKDNQASQSGHNYAAKWWTQNESPATHSGQWDVWIDQGVCGGTTTPTTPPPPTTKPPVTTPPTTTPPTTTPPTTTPPGQSGKNVVAYFAEWGVYGRQYFVNNIEKSGQASRLTHLLYAFGNVTNGACQIGDAYADYQMTYTSANSVDGVADTWDAPLAGSFNQLRKLKKLHPNLKVLWSFGGWTWSGGLGQAAANPTAFADSCYQLVHDPRWADVFDGIDIDWEYPGACGLSCDTTPKEGGYSGLISALRTKFGSSAVITSAISADGTNGGKLEKADYAKGIEKLNLVFPMTYDYFGAFNPQGPTAPHSPLTNYTGIPQAGFYADAAIQKLKSFGVPSNKILLGVGAYGRGWTGVTQSAPGGTATGAAPGTYEAGIEDYKVLKNTCPATSVVASTAYAKCGSNWWSYDTPGTIKTKMDYVKQQGLGGSFMWELSGDNGDILGAVKNNL